MDVARSSAVIARWALLLVLSASAVGCIDAPNLGDQSDERPGNGGLQEAWWTTQSCGVGPNDAATATTLNGQLRQRLKAQMNAERVACARIIVQTTLTRGYGEKGAQIAIATAIVETVLENITVAVDHDSLGLFQQRPSSGWGIKEDLINPVYATNAFLNAMTRRYGESWRDKPVGEVAQGVQRSAYPSRYAEQADDALIIARVLGETVCPGAKGVTQGAIDAKFQDLGGCKSFLGAPLTNELKTPAGDGRYNHFEHGSIYWTDKTGAHEIHGVIRDAWEVSGWEKGTLGYPTSDETATADTMGSFSTFQKGAIYVSPTTGAHAVNGAIYDKWKQLGLEKSDLGYPISDEYDASGGKRTDFQHGSITWSNNVASVDME